MIAASQRVCALLTMCCMLHNVMTLVSQRRTVAYYTRGE